MRDLSIEVPRGVVAGFIGPNGAGKTTTLAMLLGLVQPTAGTATVLGASLAEPAAYLHRVGALIETPALWPGLSGHANLRALATLGGHDLERIPEVLALVGLEERARDRVAGYSLGMKQRLGIAAARLDELPAGGRTPLAEGLLQAAETLRIEHVRDPRRRPLLVVVTDGRATSGPDALQRAHRLAVHLADTGITSLVVDCESGPMRLGLASQLADVLNAEHVPLAEVSAEALTSLVRERAA